jgi:uncharacterized protein (DUF58 family)
LFEEEQDRVVQLLIDCSASMEGEKIAQARRLAGVLSVVALARSDRVAVGGVDQQVRGFSPPRRGKELLPAVFRSIEEIPLGAETDLVRAIDAWPRLKGAGIAVLFTDFLFPEGAESVLKRLLGRGLEVHAFHLFDPAELRPPVEGDLLVVDRETGVEVAVTLDEPTLARFEARVRSWMSGIETLCQSLGVAYVPVSTDVPIDELVLRDLRRLGVLG